MGSADPAAAALLADSTKAWLQPDTESGPQGSMADVQAHNGMHAGSQPDQPGMPPIAEQNGSQRQPER